MALKLVACVFTLAFCQPVWGTEGAPARPSFPELLAPRMDFFALATGDGGVYVFGGTNPEAGVFLEVYRTDAGSRRAATMPVPGGNAEINSALLLDEKKVLACFPTPSCLVYLPAEDRWEQRAVEGYVTPLVRLKDGRILRAGGLLATFSKRESYLIDPATLAATRVGDMTEPRWTQLMMRLLDGRVLAPGGVDSALGVSVPLRSAEAFDPSTGRWAALSKMNRVSGLLRGVVLLDGRVVGGHQYAAEVYSPDKDAWAVIDGLTMPASSRVALLPSGDVLVSGGLDSSGNVTAVNTIFDPVRMKVRLGNPMKIPRARHALIVLNDGSVLAMGGQSKGGTATASVEKITWEPRSTTTLDQGFYVATSTARASDDAGFAGIEVNTNGQMDGGLNFGGSLPGGGKDVGFAGFYLPEAQMVTGSVDFQPIGAGTFEVTMRLLDVNKQPEAPPITGGTHIAFTQALPAGFHVIDLQTSERSPPATYQFALSVPRLAGGAVAGGVLDPATSSAPGYVAFYLAERQDVTIRLYNENTYGSPRGAGEVILTLYDSIGRVIARSGPGASPP